MRKKLYLIVISILLLSIFSGCVDRTDEIVIITREFIKDYVKNPETIQFNNETIFTEVNYWSVHGSGTIEYEGSIKNFSYHIFVISRNNRLECILKQLIIGGV